MSEDRPDGYSQIQTNASRPPAAKDIKKDRLAAALRENLKRRKAQTSARRQETAPNAMATNETAPK